MTVTRADEVEVTDSNLCQDREGRQLLRAVQGYRPVSWRWPARAPWFLLNEDALFAIVTGHEITETALHWPRFRRWRTRPSVGRGGPSPDDGQAARLGRGCSDHHPGGGARRWGVADLSDEPVASHPRHVRLSAAQARHVRSRSGAARGSSARATFLGAPQPGGKAGHHHRRAIRPNGQEIERYPGHQL